MVKQGYKQTENGLIPEDWEVDYLSNMSFRIGDGIHSTPIYSEQDNFYFINGNNLDNGSISIDSATKTVSFEQYKLHKRDLGSNSILLSINGTIGNIAFYKNESIILGKSACYINLKNGVNKKYIFYTLQSNFVQMYFEDNLTGSTIKNLGLGTISNTQILLPPLAEQKAIATALSDADTWIESLEQLIVKKKLIKQGAMQTLFTPKEDWEVKKLGEVLKSVSSGTSNTQSDGHNFPIYGSTGIIGFKNYYDYEGDNITVARVGANAGKVNNISGKYCVSDNTLLIIPTNEIQVKFLFYFLIKVNLNSLVFGSGQPLITGGQLKIIDIILPSLLEQTRIATILSDMDTELETLENQLTKARQIKQGMMQELLTGRVRLV